MMSSSSSSNVITNLNSNSILVAMRQKNNPILRDINNVKYEFYPNLIPDFVNVEIYFEKTWGFCSTT